MPYSDHLALGDGLVLVVVVVVARPGTSVL